MAEYKETLADGTVRIVHYNPHHDGPVSERITLANRIRFFERKLRQQPGNPHFQRKLAAANRSLSALDHPDHRRPQKRNRHQRLNHNNGRKGNRQRYRHNRRFPVPTSQTSKAQQPLDPAALRRPQQPPAEKNYASSGEANPPPPALTHPGMPDPVTMTNPVQVGLTAIPQV